MRDKFTKGYSDVNTGASINDDAVELGKAIQEWKKKTGKVCPSSIELLQIAKNLGYKIISGES